MANPPRTHTRIHTGTPLYEGDVMDIYVDDFGHPTAITFLVIERPGNHVDDNLVGQKVVVYAVAGREQNSDG